MQYLEKELSDLCLIFINGCGSEKSQPLKILDCAAYKLLETDRRTSI
jgi:hypothetical protein